MQYGKYLIILGRTHIHLFDVQTFTSHYLHNGGEDDAEKWALVFKAREIQAQNVFEKNDSELTTLHGIW